MERANHLRVVATIVAAVLAACLLVVAKPALAVITPTSTASDISSAVTSNPAFVTGASFSSVPPLGTPNAVSDSALTAFPTNGADYGILTTGNANSADDPNNSGFTTAANGGGPVRGDTDRDVTILKVDLDVPSGANCLSVDFQFLSEEYPEFVGTQYNDAFIAELDSSTWTTSGTAISAPNNFAFDPSNNVISINSSGVANMTAANSSGTTYDGGTQLLAAKTPITPGAHSLYLSIFDQGDQAYDSAVFVDNLDLYSSSTADCQKGAQVPDNQPPTADAGGPYEVDEGGSVNLDGSLSSDPENGALTYAWDLDNDGQYDDSTDANPSFSAANLDGPSSHTVKLEVTDPDGATATDEATVNVNNVDPAATFGATSPVNEGDAFDLSLTGPSDASAADEAAGFTYAFDCGNGYEAFGPGNTASCPTNDNGTRAVGGKIQDDDGGVTEYTGSVDVNNVSPTIQSISNNVSQTLTGKSVSFTASTTDPSSADTAAGFTYAWLVDGSASTFTGNPLNQSFSTCGDHSVSATATDKDGGVSASVASSVVSVSEAHFRPPLNESMSNTVQKGRVVPVKISIGCGGVNLTGLSPAIQLLNGDKTAGGEADSDAIETLSSSAADTTGFMRSVDGGYIYNLQVPSNAAAGDLFTIRVRPFGDGNPSSDMRVVLKIRK